jgi:alpha-tubulin suppressor-like RCC1 family protein
VPAQGVWRDDGCASKRGTPAPGYFKDITMDTKYVTLVPSSGSAADPDAERGVRRTGAGPVPGGSAPVLLPAPACAEAASGYLIPDALPAKGVEFTIAAYPGMAQGDYLLCYFDKGGPGEYTSPEIDITKNSVGKPQTFTVPKANVVKALDKDVKVYYTVEFVDGTNADSPQLALHIGEPTKLKAPRVDEAPDGHLSDALAHADVHVRIPVYDGMAAKDQIYMYWGTAGDPGYYDDEITIRAVREVAILVPAEYVENWLDKSVKVTYNVKRGDADYPSEPLTLLIGNAEDPNLMPPPTVQEAFDGILNPDLVNPGGAKALIGPNATLANGVTGRVVWCGGPSNGGAEWPFDISERYLTNPYPVTIPYDNIVPFIGKTATLSYEADILPPLPFQSNVLTLKVERKTAQVSPASIPELVNDVLDPRNVSPSDGAFVYVPPNEQMKVDDTVRLTWACENSLGNWDNSFIVLPSDIGKSIGFQVPFQSIIAGRESKVTVSYDIVRGGKTFAQGTPLTLLIHQGTLPAPTIDEAKQDKLDPADCANGATVRLPASGSFLKGDLITLNWQGASTADGTIAVPHTVTDQESGGDITLLIPLKTVQADVGQSVTLGYTVQRASSTPDETSPPSIYDVVAVPDKGKLLVMGARNNRSVYRGTSTSQYLSAFDKTTLAPVSAQWSYVDQRTSVVGTSFKDTRPWVPLTVQTQDDSVTLNWANIVGSGSDAATPGASALAAHLNHGNVIAWGVADFGGNEPPTTITYNDVVEASSSQKGFAVRRKDGRIAAWGTPALPDGFVMTDAARISGNASAFAVLRTTGQAVAWGDATNGGKVTDAVAGLSDLTTLHMAGFAFASIRKTGNVVAWGNANFGGLVPTDIGQMTDIVDVRGNYTAFCALRANKTVVGWGQASDGGAVPTEVAARSDILELASASARAFAVLTEGRQVLAWGLPANGGTLPADIASLSDIAEVTATWGAFAARRANGTVVAWGNGAQGGTVPDAVALCNDIVQVCGTGRAFAALRKNGQVVAWGDQTVGGNTAAVAAKLQNVRALYASSESFVALLDGGGIVTWGVLAGGGDNSKVPTIINENGALTYVATAASRGLLG